MTFEGDYQVLSQWHLGGAPVIRAEIERKKLQAGTLAGIVFKSGQRVSQ